MQNLTQKRELLQDIKEGDIRIIKWLDKEEKEEFWKILETATNLTHFRFTLSSSKELEEDLPKLIKRNPNLLSISIYFYNDCLSNSTNLNKALQKHKQGFEKIEIIYAGEYVYDCGKRTWSRYDEDIYFNSLISSFKNCSIKKLFIENVTFQFQLDSIEEINGLKELELYMCTFHDNIFQSTYPIGASKLKLINIRTSSYSIYDFIRDNFEDLHSLEISLPGTDIDYLELENCLESCFLKELIIGEFSNHVNQEYLPNILITVESLMFKKLHDHSSHFSFPVFSLLSNHETLKSFKSISVVNNFEDVDKFLKNNQYISNFKIVLKETIPQIKTQLKILAKGISSNHSIENLHIEIPMDDNFRYLYEGIKENNNLTILNLSGCHLNDLGCELIGNYLLKNDSLSCLDISYNEFTEKGLNYICKGLMNHKYLKNLILNYNRHIYDNGCIHLRDLLISNQYINELEVKSCSFTEKGFINLTEALLFNSTLIHLKFKYNNFILKEELNEFKTKLFFNLSLTCFNFSFILESTKDYEFIKSILKRNSGFIKTLKMFSKNFFNNLQFKFN